MQNQIDTLAEELGAAYSLIEAAKNANSLDNPDIHNEHDVLLEYALGYLDRCFDLLDNQACP